MSDGQIKERYLQESTCCLFPIPNLESMATTGEKVSAVKLPADWNSFFPRQRCTFSKLWPPRKDISIKKYKVRDKDSFYMHRILIISMKCLRDNFYETVVLRQQCWRSSFCATLKYPRPAMESNIFYDDIQLKSAAPSNSSFSHSLHRGLD